MKSEAMYVAAAAMLLAACGKNDEIKVYRVSKAPLEEAVSGGGTAMPTNAGTPSGMPGMTGGATAAPAVADAPPGWEPQPPSQMRQASFLVKGEQGAVADISLVSLGAAADNVLDNVNRWLDQLGQPAISQDKLAQMSERLPTKLGEVVVVDLAGLPKDADPAKDGRIIAGMTNVNGATMFFKMRGNAALVESQKAEFVKWIAATCDAQAGGSAAAISEESGDAAGAPQIKWQTPDGWSDVPPSSMRFASFSVAGDNGSKLDISVVTFPGDGGTDGDNINRWRKQIGLAPVDAKGIAGLVTPVNAPSGEFLTLDMKSSDARVLAAWTRHDGRSWFFKMTGPEALVEKEKGKFLNFLRSIHFHS